MTSCSQVSEGLWFVDALYLKPGMAGCYVLRDGDRAAIIETGTHHSVPGILAALRELDIDVAAVDFVIVTHVHLDHAGGAGTLMGLLPNARLVVHPRGARHMIDPTKLMAGTVAVYGEETTQKLYGDVPGVDASRVIEATEDLCIAVGARSLKFFDTPGHARHHACIYDEASRGVFTGDTFGISYRSLDVEGRAYVFITTTPVHFDPDAMHRSIDKILALNPAWTYLTHFGAVGEPATVAAALHRQIDTFVRIAQEASAHADREQRVADAMRTSMLEEVRDHGCTLTDQAIIDAIDMDVRLNAQGLIHWLTLQDR